MNKTSQNYFSGIKWFVLSLIISASNDLISRYVGLKMHSTQISFFRFLFSTLSILPFVIYQGTEKIKTNHPFMQISRGVLLFFGTTAWTYGLTLTQVPTATVISFTIPLFVLVLAIFFLKESIVWQRWLATIIGFIGIVITLDPNTEDFKPEILIFILAALSFALLDILNKKFIVTETTLTMLFYSALVTTLLAFPAALHYWQSPTLQELTLLIILGIGANLILFCLLKAFAAVDATALSPYRYLELIISSGASYLVFSEFPSKSTWYGALIIIPTTLFIVYSENRIACNKSS